ncbi:hypothetical protein RNJ44_04655 [Nakaseomyces bracarensis]|uniref:EngB-type G domain-containing protein n=1 Tax=Nakaseomyces bracarensis TaxID=273131 RepID=A0ABR4NVJ6_9SACH
MKKSSFQLINAKEIVKNVKIKPIKASDILIRIEPKPKRTTSSLRNKDDSFKKSWLQLNVTMNKDYKPPSETNLNLVNHFFNKSQCVYEWSAAKLLDIPGEQMNLLYAKSQNQVSSKVYPGKTKFPFQLVNPLPEIAFLGKTNVGKSTILNNLNTRFQNKDLDGFARMSKRAGFTKTLNCYNVGNRFRLIDTPGYGFRSSGEQGTITTEYLLNRKELRRCFVLISAESMITPHDDFIIGYLTDNGIPFEIVFTKMDKIKNLDTFIKSVEDSNIQNLPTLPKLIFTNSKTTKHLPNRFGVNYLRYSIFESCGLDPSIKPQNLHINPKTRTPK